VRHTVVDESQLQPQLGGKDPAYVRADANVDFTVGELVDGAFFNSGQSCCAVEVSRFSIVSRAILIPIYSEFMYTSHSLINSLTSLWRL
jgi:hypothetical protein